MIGVTYSRQEERHYMIGAALRRAMTKSQELSDIVGDTITQLLEEDLGHLTRASNTLTRSAIRRGYKHGAEKSKLPTKKAAAVDFIESHQSRFLRAKTAIVERVEAFRKDVGASLSKIQALTPPGGLPYPAHSVWELKISQLVWNPCIPRYADAPTRASDASPHTSVETAGLAATAATEQKEPAAAPQTPDLGPLSLEQLPIVKSNLTSRNPATGSRWDCTRVMVRLSPTAQDSRVCLDSGAAYSVASRDWVLSFLPKVQFLNAPANVGFRGFTSSIAIGVKAFVRIPLYLTGTTRDGTRVLAQLSHHSIAIIDDVSAKMLIGNDIIGSEGIIINPSVRRAFIGSCEVMVNVTCSRSLRPVEQPTANEPPDRYSTPAKEDPELTSDAIVKQEVKRALSALQNRVKQFNGQDMECQKILRGLAIHQKLLTGCRRFFRSDAGKDRIREFYFRTLINKIDLPTMPGRAAAPDSKAEACAFADCMLASGIATRDIEKAREL
ncbi:MAG: hypothetical protein Q9174_004861, partial [Haloplaca sp. 1 TL-2023]